MYCHHGPPGSPVVQSVEAVLRLASARDPDHEVGGLGEPQQPEQPPAGGHGEAGQWSAGCWHAGPGGEGDHCNHWPLLLDTSNDECLFPRVSRAWCLAWRSCYRVADGRSSARGNISKIGNW